MDSYVVFLLVFGACVIGAVSLPREIHGFPISLPALQVMAGFALFLAVPTLPDVDPVNSPIVAERLAELVVIVSLTGAGLTIDRVPGWRSWGPAWRLLALAMPATIAATALLGWGVVGLAPAAAVLLGAVIAPTDPVLASDVQVDPPNEGDVGEVPVALTVEAGLNDGLAFPFVNAALAMLAGGAWFGSWVLDEVVLKLASGLLVGYLCGRFLGWLVFVRFRDRWLPGTSEGLAAVGATLAVYGLAELAHGYGFLAVFIAAVTVRSQERQHEHHTVLHASAEAVEHLGSALVLVLVGGAIASGALGPLGWKEILVGVAIVAVVRPVVAWSSLLRTHLDRRQRIVTAVFGIRGVGSVYYLAHAATEADVPQLERLWAIVLFVIVLSVATHGAFASMAVRASTEGEAEVV